MYFTARTESWRILTMAISCGKPRLARNSIPRQALLRSSSTTAFSTSALTPKANDFIALDARTGAVVWEIPRWYPGYATQIISLEPPDPQLILSKNDRISAHDLKTGAEIWKIEGEDGWVHNTMLVTGDGLIISCSTPRVKVIRADGSEKLWETVGGSPFSPILYDNGRVWWFYRSILHCRDARTGEKIYRERIPAPGDAYAAPIKADGKIYLLTRQDGAVVIDDGPEYRLLAHNKFAADDSMFDSTPAISGKNLILRSYRYLYCIGTD